MIFQWTRNIIKGTLELIDCPVWYDLNEFSTTVVWLARLERWCSRTRDTSTVSAYAPVPPTKVAGQAFIGLRSLQHGTNHPARHDMSSYIIVAEKLRYASPMRSSSWSCSIAWQKLGIQCKVWVRFDRNGLETKTAEAIPVQRHSEARASAEKDRSACRHV